MSISWIQPLDGTYRLPSPHPRQRVIIWVSKRKLSLCRSLATHVVAGAEAAVMGVDDVNALTLTLFATVVAIIVLGAVQDEREAALCHNRDGVVTTIEGQTACVKVLSMLH
jgi:hypothetical protein